MSFDKLDKIFWAMFQLYLVAVMVGTVGLLVALIKWIWALTI